ncbi:MAG: hypothetical protein K2N89_06445 [Lachnospiraceae bacterium]|nr:hypothetical protein [Lachnospiraceae bacterium]
MADKRKKQTNKENKMWDWKKWEWKNYIRAAVIVLMIEVFLWNHSFWISLGNEPITVDELYTETGEVFSLPANRSWESDTYFEIRDINRPIKNIYLNVETDKEIENDTLTVRFSMIDEGRKDYYDLTTRTISSHLQKLDYISLYPYGDLKALKIRFPNDSGTLITVTDVVLNPRVPMFFSVLRVLIMYFVYLVGRTLFFKSYETYYQPDSKWQKRVTVGICMILCAAVFSLTQKSTSEYGLGTMDKYAELTYSLEQGVGWLNINVDERLLSAENPYDRTERRELGIGGYKWDYAYYNGKIYVYFGVVPVWLTYLPYYMLTGEDLPHTVAYTTFLMALIVGAFMLLNTIIKKYCKKLPLKLYYLFLVTFAMGIGTMIFAKRLCIYNMPIMAAVCLTLWGLYLWISSEKESGHNTIWKIFLGALCMALVAGCRPQLLLGSFLAFPILGKKLKQMFADFKKKTNIKENVLFLIAFCVPYLVVAALLMKYNYDRFDSPFDFGASYNLTTNDMRYRGVHIARMISGVWSLLFELPMIDLEFPYLGSTWLNTIYQGITIQEKGIGGIFMTNIILLPAFLIYRFRDKLREKQMMLFASICMFSGIIITCVDVQGAGILVRYMADFAIFFYLTSFAVIFSFIDRCYEKEYTLTSVIPEKVWCRGLALLCCVTIVYWCVTILLLYEDHDYNTYQLLWYNKLRVLFGVLDV